MIAGTGHEEGAEPGEMVEGVTDLQPQTAVGGSKAAEAQIHGSGGPKESASSITSQSRARTLRSSTPSVAGSTHLPLEAKRTTPADSSDADRIRELIDHPCQLFQSTTATQLPWHAALSHRQAPWSQGTGAPLGAEAAFEG